MHEQSINTLKLPVLSRSINSFAHGRTGRKTLGGRKEICTTQFRIVPALSKKIFRRNFPKLLSTWGGSGYEKFLLDSIFSTKLTEFPTKLTEFVPFIFVISQYCPTVKRILPDWLCLPNKLGGLPPPPPPRPVRPCLCITSHSHHITTQFFLIKYLGEYIPPF